MDSTTQNQRLFRQAQETGELKGIALEVYGIVCRKPGLTCGEIAKLYSDRHPGTSRTRNEIAKRVNDLANSGAVRVAGKTVCPESGRNAAQWAVTGKAPKKKAKKVETPEHTITYDTVAGFSVTQSIPNKSDFNEAELEVIRVFENLEAEIRDLRVKEVKLQRECGAWERVVDFYESESAETELELNLVIAAKRKRIEELELKVIHLHANLLTFSKIVLALRYIMPKKLVSVALAVQESKI
jgi:hypothetical protein